MKRSGWVASFLIIASVAMPASAARRPLVCEAAGTFGYVAFVEPWMPTEIHATGSCSGDMGGPYTVTIDGTGIADDLSRCGTLSNALMEVTVTLINTNTGKTIVLSQKWVIYLTAFSSVGTVVIRSGSGPGAGVMLTRLFNMVRCIQDDPPVPPYQSAAVLRWAFVR